MARWLTGTTDKGYEEIVRRFRQMLEDGRHIFDAASNALLGGTDPEAIRSDLFSTDKRINETEQQVRRQIVVHGTVHGAQTFPTLLVVMSLAKDAERIGDYAKNIFDLAAAGVDFREAPDRPTMLRYRDRAAEMITESGAVFAGDDQDRAHALLAEADGMLDTFDQLVDALVHSDDVAHDAVPRALYYRHLKRIVAHLMNLLTAVVVPVDRIDYLDESAGGIE